VKARLFHGLVAGAVTLGILSLCVLLLEVFLQGFGSLNWGFLTSFPSRFAEKAGLWSALIGSLWTMALTAAFSVPLGVGAALYLEEYAKRGKLSHFIEINIANLAGVPSIIYGLLGLVVFVRQMSLGRSVIAGALTLTLLILPVIIVASREALRGVPTSIRQAAYALGATKWQTLWAHVLPAATPGILTGVILSLSRAMGETAPLIVVGAVAYVAFTPDGLTSAFTVLPIQIYDWTSRPQEAFHGLAAAGILVLLVVLLSLNAVAIVIRNRYQRKFRW
jgi:phosphate transport system permease protein